MYTHLQRTVLLCNKVAFFCKVTCTIDPTKPLLKHRKLMTSTGFLSLQFPPPLHNFNLPSIFTPSPIPIFRTLSWVQLISSRLWPSSQLSFQSYYQISPAICALSSSPPHAAKNSWENWITMLIDSATILRFPMSAEPRADRQKGYSFLLGRSRLSTHQLLPAHQPSVPTHILTAFTFHIGVHLLLRTFRSSAVNPTLSLLCVPVFIWFFAHLHFTVHHGRILNALSQRTCWHFVLPLPRLSIIIYSFLMLPLVLVTILMNLFKILSWISYHFLIHQFSVFNVVIGLYYRFTYIPNWILNSDKLLNILRHGSWFPHI